ncbi:hypothetical protein [Kordia jejudonensis]|uniref:hypothetical protein n=1 Tax=Kordia jejudonensis TaxID=1348245 RepID=UPI0006294F8E|nr:hypothetical protein [Kordia jejudonensis]
MKLNRNIFIVTSLALIALVSVSFNSCEYFIKSENSENIQKSKSNNNITTGQSEAKLLVQASKNNLDVIELCSIIEDVSSDDEVKNLVEEIKNEQLKVLETYSKVASENVISLPRYTNMSFEDITKLNDSLDLELHLKLLSKKIHKQKDLLNKLSDTTNNEDFKELVQSANDVLEESFDKSVQTLEILNSDS